MQRIWTKMESELYEGQRLVVFQQGENDHLGTVRYVGTIEKDVLQRVWVGIQLDRQRFSSVEKDGDDFRDVILMKPGCLGEHRYFDDAIPWTKSKPCEKCERFRLHASDTMLTPASSIQESQIGYDFLTCVRYRYCCNPADFISKGGYTPNDVEISGKKVEFLGFREAAQHFQRIDKLKCIDLNGYYVSCFLPRAASASCVVPPNNHGDKAESRAVMFPHVERLMLTRCLISDFKEIILMVSHMPRLQFLSLEGLQFRRSSARATRALLQHVKDEPGFPWMGVSTQCTFPCIRTLDLNASNVEWLDLLYLGDLFPHLTELHLSRLPQLFDDLGDEHFMSYVQHKGLKDCRAVCREVVKATLEDCGIDSYESIAHLFSFFPKVLHLTLNGNCLGDLTGHLVASFDEVIKQGFLSLESLFIEDNHIGNLETLGYLSALLPNLIKLRWQGNPLHQNNSLWNTVSQRSADMSNDFSASILRHIMISLFPKLLFLNGSEVVPEERRQAELYCIALASRSDAVFSSIDPQGHHTQRLKDIHGMSDRHQDAPKVQPDKPLPLDVTIRFIRLDASGSPSNRVHVECTKRFPIWLPVRMIKTFIQKKFGIDVVKQRLFLSCSKQHGLRVPLFDDECSLEYYGVTKDNFIYIDVADE